METSSALIGILSAIGIGWMGWVSVTLIQNSNKISAFLASHDQLHGDTSELKRMMQTMGERFDLFLKTEIDSLKEIVKENGITKEK